MSNTNKVPNYQAMNYNDVRKYATSIGVSGLGTTEEIKARIEQHFLNQGKAGSVDNSAPVVPANLELVIQKMDEMIGLGKQILEKLDNFEAEPVTQETFVEEQPSATKRNKSPEQIESEKLAREASEIASGLSGIKSRDDDYEDEDY